MTNKIMERVKYKYNAEKNAVDEQITIHLHDLRCDDNLDDYKNHLASLKSFPVHGEHKWADGQELIEGKDFEINHKDYIDINLKEGGKIINASVAIPLTQPIQEDSNDIANVSDAEKILYKHWAKWCKETFRNVDMSEESFKENMGHSFILDAMEECAIDFAEWIRENYEPEFVNGNAWVDILDSDQGAKEFSSKELYQLFKK